jgi:hypothetical protein
MAMTKSLRIAAIAAGLAVLPVAAMAQDQPTVPDRSNEIQTGTRIQTITVIGAIRDRRATKRAERPADRSLPELPITYEDSAPRT